MYHHFDTLKQKRKQGGAGFEKLDREDREFPLNYFRTKQYFITHFLPRCLQHCSCNNILPCHQVSRNDLPLKTCNKASTGGWLIVVALRLIASSCISYEFKSKNMMACLLVKSNCLKLRKRMDEKMPMIMIHRSHARRNIMKQILQEG